MRYQIHKLFITICLSALMAVGMIGCSNINNTNNTTATVTQELENSAENKEEMSGKQNEREYIITVTSNNSWESDGMICTQFDGMIKNDTEEIGKNWKVAITVPEGSKIENGWNGNYNLNGTTLEVTPVDYNTEVAAGAEMSFGFILDTPNDFTPEQVVLEISGKQYGLGEVKDANEDTATEQVVIKEEDATNKDKMETKDVSGTPFANHGALSVKGTNIVDKKGDTFQLKGVSTHGINWFPEYVNKEAFMDLSEYGVNAIRLAMYTADYNGYCSGGNQEELECIIDKGVQACTELGMYVIVDWHILNDSDPNQNKEAALSFFEKTSKKYANYDNVIYEICNEPNGGTTWESVKSYATEVISVIRKYDKNALVIVGTPNWSQDVDVASNHPITGQDNIVYAVHFYAATHQENIRSKVETAISNGIPVIVSESSICEASGNGSINYDEGQKWMELIGKYHLSCFAWSLCNKDETSSFLKTSVTKTSGFLKDDFSDVGKWYLDQYDK